MKRLAARICHERKTLKKPIFSLTQQVLMVPLKAAWLEVTERLSCKTSRVCDVTNMIVLQVHLEGLSSERAKIL